jgi:hypothetical protein
MHQTTQQYVQNQQLMTSMLQFEKEMQKRPFNFGQAYEMQS